MPRKWSGKTLKCENLTVHLADILSERYVDNLGECVVVADGKLKGVDSPVIAKLRIQLDPEAVDDDDREAALRAVATEYAALVDLVDSGHTPRYLAFSKMLQDRSMPYPGGYIHVLVMSKVPGQNVQKVLFDLTEEERAVIRDQLAGVLEYLVDLEAVDDLGDVVGDKITPESSIVKLFGVWNEYARRND
ncbi:MAG: hypothetical protein M1840_006725 [Geoglossum simile]|nr:MAG: hypothetical protein M1840_006725 [Geoglossum simile]